MSPLPCTFLGFRVPRVESFNDNEIISFIQDEIWIEHLAREGSDERRAWEDLVEEPTQRAAGVFQ